MLAKTSLFLSLLLSPALSNPVLTPSSGEVISTGLLPLETSTADAGTSASVVLPGRITATYPGDFGQSPNNSTASMAFPTLDERDPPMGVNCLGSYYCDAKGGVSHPSKFLRDYMLEIPDDELFEHHQIIACTEGLVWPDLKLGYLCAWLDYADHIADGYYDRDENKFLRTGKRVKEMMHILVNRGCKRCGAHPLEYSANLLYEGHLRMDGQRHGCPDAGQNVVGICPPPNKQSPSIDPVGVIEIVETTEEVLMVTADVLDIRSVKLDDR
ncbi:hypothetical protein TWF696_005629 [Orbilia brochopaga]|uniref:Killer toxin Kp4 domain-containing protein n=1 Tax=Orbilia brochopaga TaxID=3140254 RepID=A0AAV9V4L2_9PEZI